MAHDVFISHSGKDKSLADAICAMLELAAVRCWIAPRDIQPGTEWGEAIVDGISRAKAMVLVFSNNANESAQVRREVQRAFEAGLTVIPFRVEAVLPAKALAYYIGPVHWLDALTPPVEAHLSRLRDTVLKAIGPKPPPPAALETGRRPFSDQFISADANDADAAHRKALGKSAGRARAACTAMAVAMGIYGLASLSLLMGDFQVSRLENGQESAKAFTTRLADGPALWQTAMYWVPFTWLAMLIAWLFWGTLMGRYAELRNGRTTFATSPKAILFAALLPAYNFVAPPIVTAALFVARGWNLIAALIASIGWWVLLTWSFFVNPHGHGYPLTTKGIPPISPEWKQKVAEYIRLDYTDIAAAIAGGVIFWLARPGREE